MFSTGRQSVQLTHTLTYSKLFPSCGANSWTDLDSRQSVAEEENQHSAGQSMGDPCVVSLRERIDDEVNPSSLADLPEDCVNSLEHSLT